MKTIHLFAGEYKGKMRHFKRGGRNRALFLRLSDYHSIFRGCSNCWRYSAVGGRQRCEIFFKTIILWDFHDAVAHIRLYDFGESQVDHTSRLMRAPLGVAFGKTVGNMKNVIVNRVETIELPLAHNDTGGYFQSAFAYSVICLYDCH
ncbi:MAG: hypothetical protein LBU32_28130 [Clostridiales bacterium]|jgi:hypothetical protein|nr:hypothetical protein [Clostridiales bacterium]